MSENTNALQDLKTMRDEIKLQANLLEKDTKDQWDQLEKKWAELQQKIGPAKQAATEASENIATAHRLLIDEIVSGYKKLKETL